MGIDLRSGNVSKRGEGFWRRFEAELDYLLVDARAAFLEKIKLAHPDRGGFGGSEKLEPCVECDSAAVCEAGD